MKWKRKKQFASQTVRYLSHQLFNSKAPRRNKIYEITFSGDTSCDFFFCYNETCSETFKHVVVPLETLINVAKVPKKFIKFIISWLVTSKALKGKSCRGLRMNNFVYSDKLESNFRSPNEETR